MKHLLFILMMLPAIARAESYTYNHVSLTRPGSDNFSIEKNSEAYTVGIIDFDGSTISIDEKVYKLTPMRRDNCFRYKGGMFQLVYRDNKLVSVLHYDYGKLYSYRIKHSAEPVRIRNGS